MLLYLPTLAGKAGATGVHSESQRQTPTSRNPAVIDRYLQTMVKNALEPNWEARFEGMQLWVPTGTRGHDAMEKIFELARPQGGRNGSWTQISRGLRQHRPCVSADSHRPDSRKGTPQTVAESRLWKKGGFSPRKRDTARGMISPLLANIALHGMERPSE